MKDYHCFVFVFPNEPLSGRRCKMRTNCPLEDIKNKSKCFYQNGKRRTASNSDVIFSLAVRFQFRLFDKQSMVYPACSIEICPLKNGKCHFRVPPFKLIMNENRRAFSPPKIGPGTLSRFPRPQEGVILESFDNLSLLQAATF